MSDFDKFLHDLDKPTPKRKNHRLASKEVILPSSPARVQATYLVTRVLADQDVSGILGTSKAAHKQGTNMTYKYKLCNPN